MYNENNPKQMKLELVNIENLVPPNHLLRKIDEYIDFSFITKLVKPYYSDKGRPCIDPVMLFKMLILGFIYGIRSERRLVEEIKYNVAYRWFLGLGLTDDVPNHSIFSQNRRRRFGNTDVAQKIFDNIVKQAIEYGLVEGHTLFTDSTFLKANASIGKYTKEEVLTEATAYLEELEEAVSRDRVMRGRKALKKKDFIPKVKITRVSKTDKDSGFMVRDGKPKGFYYLDHRTVDSLHNIITDVHITPGNVHDSKPYISILERQIDKFGFEVQNIALDSGYFTAHICKYLYEKDFFAVIAYRRFSSTNKFFSKYTFKYNNEKDIYTCKNGSVLRYSTTNRQGYRFYKSDPNDCKKCPSVHLCMNNKSSTRVISRHVWEDAKEWIRSNRLSPEGKKLYKQRKEKIERSFADAKELHNHRYARRRGLENVKEQCLLASAAQNIKKIALVLAKLETRLSFYFLYQVAKSFFSSLMKKTYFCQQPQSPLMGFFTL